MKFTLLTFIIAIFTITPTLAEHRYQQCTAGMETRRGNIIQRFMASGQDRYQACQNARRRCQRELNYRQREGRNPYARCITLDSRRPRYEVSCRASMHTRRGNLIQSFTGRGHDRASACQSARRSCQRDLRDRQNQGYNQYAYCQVNNGYGRGGQRHPGDYGRGQGRGGRRHPGGYGRGQGRGGRGHSNR